MHNPPKSNPTPLPLLLLLHIITTSYQYPTFDEYMLTYAKNYTQDQKVWRKQVYERRVGGFGDIVGFVPAVNNFTDWTEGQIQVLSGLKLIPPKQRVQSSAKIQTRLGAPLSVDWRPTIITSVKDQDSCGSCWSFTSVGLMEAYLIQNGKNTLDIDLSEQHLLECTPYSDCQGGYIQYGLDRISDSCPTEAQFPYNNGQSRIGGNICSAPGIQTKTQRRSYYSLTDSELITLLQKGPVAVGVASTGWISYGPNSGIIQCSSLNAVDHAVIAVGYTPDSIIIKNSWGTSWGQQGYGFVSRNASRNCKISSQAHILTQKDEKYRDICIVLILIIITIILN